jgi:hypothetical protein
MDDETAEIELVSFCSVPTTYAGLTGLCGQLEQNLNKTRQISQRMTGMWNVNVTLS